MQFTFRSLLSKVMKKCNWRNEKFVYEAWINATTKNNTNLILSKEIAISQADLFEGDRLN